MKTDRSEKEQLKNNISRKTSLGMLTMEKEHLQKDSSEKEQSNKGNPEKETVTRETDN